MNKKLIIVILGILFAILTHGYLTNHYYPLKFGMAPTESYCQLGDKMDCDVAATSRFSSVGEVPLSVFGLVFHAILLILVISAWSGLSERPQRLLRVATLLAGLSVFTSIVLAIISATQLTAWCPFCLLAYAFSVLIFIGLFYSLTEPFSYIIDDLPTLLGESKMLLFMIILIPAGSYVTHTVISKNFGGDQLDIIVHSSVNEWKASKEIDFSSFTPALIKGPSAEEAKMTLVEFADFRCGHCGHAAPSVHAFLKTHPDVRFLFFNFPLDGECNKNIGSGDGISCKLAKAVTCAGIEESSKGFQLHDHIYKNQTKFQTTHKLSDIDEKLKQLSEELHLDWDQLRTCIDSPETHEKIQNQVQAGEKSGLRGTPTFFVNNKMLSRGQFIPVLNAVYESIQKDQK